MAVKKRRFGDKSSSNASSYTRQDGRAGGYDQFTDEDFGLNNWDTLKDGPDMNSPLFIRSKGQVRPSCHNEGTKLKEHENKVSKESAGKMKTNQNSQASEDDVKNDCTGPCNNSESETDFLLLTEKIRQKYQTGFREGVQRRNGKRKVKDCGTGESKQETVVCPLVHSSIGLGPWEEGAVVILEEHEDSGKRKAAQQKMLNQRGDNNNEVGVKRVRTLGQKVKNNFWLVVMFCLMMTLGASAIVLKAFHLRMFQPPPPLYARIWKWLLNTLYSLFTF